MGTKQMSPSTQQMISSIGPIDFSMIKLKLMDTEEGEGWSADYCDRVEREYRRYLALSRHYPDKAVVPSKVVDTFWHFHILDTQASAEAAYSRSTTMETPTPPAAQTVSRPRLRPRRLSS